MYSEGGSNLLDGFLCTYITFIHCRRVARVDSKVVWYYAGPYHKTLIEFAIDGHMHEKYNICTTIYIFCTANKVIYNFKYQLA